MGWDGMGWDLSQTTTTTRAPLAVLKMVWWQRSHIFLQSRCQALWPLFVSFDVLLFQVLQFGAWWKYLLLSTGRRRQRSPTNTRLAEKYLRDQDLATCFLAAFYSGFFFKVPALSSDSEGAVVRIHSGYAVPSLTNYCQNILPMACTPGRQ